MRNEEIKLWTGDHRVLAERVLVGQVVAHDALQRDPVAVLRKALVGLLQGLGNHGCVGS